MCNTLEAYLCMQHIIGHATCVKKIFDIKVLSNSVAMSTQKSAGRNQEDKDMEEFGRDCHQSLRHSLHKKPRSIYRPRNV